MLQIKPLNPQLVPTLYSMILEAADECCTRAEVTTTIEKLMEDGFGSAARYEALLALDSEQAVGFCLFFPMYSGWKGRRTLYLEDLFVLPNWRHLGVGTRLFQQVQRLALQRGANLAWETDRDNLRLRHYFTGMGAIDRSNKVSFYMEENEMRNITQK